MLKEQAQDESVPTGEILLVLNRPEHRSDEVTEQHVRYSLNVVYEVADISRESYNGLPRGKKVLEPFWKF